MSPILLRGGSFTPGALSCGAVQRVAVVYVRCGELTYGTVQRRTVPHPVNELRLLVLSV